MEWLKAQFPIGMIVFFAVILLLFGLKLTLIGIAFYLVGEYVLKLIRDSRNSRGDK
jgi:hypothetical protein